MSKVQLICPEVSNMPWQENPGNLVNAPVWRYTENPIIDRNPVKGVARIFNSAVMPYEGKFIGVFRGKPMGFHLFTLEEVKMVFTGTLMKIKFLL